MLRFEHPYLLAAAAPLVALILYSHFRLHYRLLPSLIRLGNPMLKVVKDRKMGSKRTATLTLKLLVALLVCAAAASPYLEVEKTISREAEAEVMEVLRVAGPATVILVDVSGSMGESIPGGVKINVAKDAVKRFLEGLPNNVSVGLIAFDHRVELAAPIARNRSQVLRALEELKPGGGTMYTYPLTSALSALRPYRAFNASCAVVFVSDGLPADRGLYDDVLREMGSLNISVHTVYIGPGGDAGAEEMRRIAELTGGRFFNVETAQELVQVFEELSREVARFSAGYRSGITFTEKVVERISLHWLLLLASAVLLALLLYARYRALGLTI